MLNRDVDRLIGPHETHILNHIRFAHTSSIQQNDLIASHSILAMLAIAALVSIGYAHFEFLRWDTVIRIRKGRAQLSTYPLFAGSR